MSRCGPSRSTSSATATSTPPSRSSPAAIPETLLDRLSTASKVDDDINATLAAHEAEQANLTDMQRTAAAEVAALAEQERKLAALKKDLQSKVDAAQALVLQLTAAQRAALEAADGDKRQLGSE